MVAWCRNGTSYTASTFFAAPASVPAASPSLRASTPGCSANLTNCARMPSESSEAASPSSHWISSARRPVTACQYVSATTAMPAAQPAAQAPPVPVHGLGSRATTARTPGTALALVASYDLSVPPNTGQRSIDATSMPGTFTSMPNTALPSTLAGVSSRGTRVPSRRKSFASLRGGSFGTGSCAAVVTSLPYVSRRLLGTCTTAPRSARHAARSTFHVDAAASSSISRAAAPALRSGSHELRIAVLPPVDMRRDHPAGFSGTGPRRTVDQSASSSSARIMASPVWAPWPISDLAIVSVTIPLVPMRTQSLGANGGAAAGPGTAFARQGTTNAMTRPVVVSTNSRREMPEAERMSDSVHQGSGERGAVPLDAAEGTAPRSLLPVLGDLPDRQLSDPLSGQHEQRVAHRRRDRGCARFTDAALRVAARHDVDLHHRHLGQPEHAVVVEVALLHAALVDRDLAPQRRRQAVHDGALHLRLDDVGIHDRPAVHRADDSVHARCSVRPHRDFGHFGHVGLERRVHGAPPGATRRKRRAPTGLARGEVQRTEMPRRLAEQVPAILVRILLGGVGQLVDEAFDHERVVRVVHRAPEADRDAGVGEHIVDVDVGNRVGHADAPLHRFFVEPVLHGVGKHPGHDGRRHDAVRPGHRLAARVETCLQPVVTGGAVLRVARVVFAGPDHLHGDAGGLGGFECFLNEVELEPPTEAATQIGRVHFDLLGRDAADTGAEALRSGLELGGGPDVDPVGTDVSGAVHRLHCRMGEERQLVSSVELGGGAGQRALGVAVVASDGPGLLGLLAEQLRDGRARNAYGRALVPRDGECVPSLLGRPVAVGHDGDARRDLDDVLDARHGLRAGGVEALRRA